MLGVGRNKIYTLLTGIEREMQSGRYSRYAVADRLVNKAVLLDYLKYRNMLENKNLRRYVPPYNEAEAARMMGEKEQRCLK